MLEINNLSAGYGERAVLKDIDLKINRGELIGIIGPNGCGKTTLFRVVTKILPAFKGEVFFGGKNIKSLKNMELAKEMAVVSQDTYVQDINVEDYVLLGRFPHRKRFNFFETRRDIDIASNAMKLTGVLEFSKRKMNELSGGERQRVHVGRAITQEPKLLLLDEPTTHLDIGHQIELLDLLRKLNRDNGLTIIVILHDLNLAGCYCDRLVLMKEGRVYKEGLPEDILTYKNIEEVYRTIVVVEKSQITGKPNIFVVPNVH